MVDTSLSVIELFMVSKYNEIIKLDWGGKAFMKQFCVQMIDDSISSQWWKTIMKHFVKIGNEFEIRCWREEVAEIESASLYGVAVEDKYEISIKGSVTKELLERFCNFQP